MEKLSNVVFLDRDGVINRDSPDFVKSRDEFEFIPGSLSALSRLNENGFDTIVITNQSAVNRGIISLATLEDMHRMLRTTIRQQGGQIRDIFFCPHRPDEGCSCRKPKPGMIRQACERYAIDLHTAVMVGDSKKDIECGRNAGCGATVLVRTGNGLETEKALNARQIAVDFVADNLQAAIDWIVDTR